VSLCFLDVAEPSLAAALDGLRGQQVVVVPVLLSAGYHVTSDIPAAVAGRDNVRVARHLGPDPAVIGAVADRLAEADGSGPVLLAAIASSRSSARAEIDQAADALGARIGQRVRVLELGSDVPADVETPFAIATYLLAEGGFLNDLRARTAGKGVVADPIGVHPALVALVWERYDAMS
jgi:sirohydrochlorin ferrochelatase